MTLSVIEGAVEYVNGEWPQKGYATQKIDCPPEGILEWRAEE
jgi:hypothetical protein